MNRKKSGFTLAEVLIVVAIIVVLAAIVLINIIQHRIALKQTELDNIAKEIFVAAQNHLTMAEGQGYYGLTTEQYGQQSMKATRGAEPEPGVFYLAYPAVEENRDMWAMLLPTASVDEAVRLGGSYILRYNLTTGQMLDVFYVEKTSFADDDYNLLMSEYQGAAHRSDRRNYKGTKTIIGWYGLSDEVESIAKAEWLLEAPTVFVTNAERLEVLVKNPNNDSTKFANMQLKLIITGETSGNQKVIELIDSAGNKAPYLISLDNSEFRIVLDDVTSADEHFYRFQADGLIPGENITVQAVALDNSRLSNIARSSGITTNSLFASKKTEGSDTYLEAQITNFRHLENLDPTLSGWTETMPTHAVQKANLDWDSFLKQIRTLRGPGASDVVNVCNAEGLTARVAQDNCYLPVNPGEMMIQYLGDGSTNVIRGVKIDTTEIAAGLFGTLETGRLISNLQLINFSVNASDGKAGALAGVVNTGTTVEKVLVRHEKTTTPESYRITGKTAAGGLVGDLKGTATQCAAAVLVEATGGDAGGLIGTSSGTGTVQYSYSGGHTKDGAYIKYKTDGTIELIDYISNNVTATAAAGGLIGSMNGGTVTGSYSTCSAKGVRAAGGLIGNIAGGAVSNSYATGWVTGEAEGGFVGKGSGTNTFNGCGYFSIVSQTLGDDGKFTEKSAGVSGVSGVTAMDADAHTYETWFSYQRPAVNYDGALNSYNQYYALKTIRELAGQELAGQTGADWLTTHYGDWPMPEIIVVNNG